MSAASNDPNSNPGVGASVMQGGGRYSANSRPQQVAAAPAHAYLALAATQVPLPGPDTPVLIGDFGCAGGANEMLPMALAVDGLRATAASHPIEVAHTDLPENDFGPLFALLDSADSYLAGRRGVYPSVIGRTLYGPLFPDRRLTLGWSAITLHWLSRMPTVVPDQVYPNLTTGSARESLRRQADMDWHTFLVERARELVDHGELILVAGASRSDGSSGAEALFTVVGDVLVAMVAEVVLRPGEQANIFYPTWNRTADEWLAPFAGDLGEAFEVVDHRLDGFDDAHTYPQFARDGDDIALAAAYTPFVRAVTERPFFRWLDQDRPPAERAAITDEFYRRLEQSLASHPAATAVWHVMSLRIRRRARA